VCVCVCSFYSYGGFIDLRLHNILYHCTDILLCTDGI